jgi:hypothetical protein
MNMENAKSPGMVKNRLPVSDELMQKRLKSGKYRLVDHEIEKRCARCQEYWPADCEFFHSGNGDLDGLHGWCKACLYEWRVERSND